MACFGDAHVSKLKKMTVNVPNLTMTINGLTKISVENPAAKGAAGKEDDPTDKIPDNIFDSISDFDTNSNGSANDSFTPGGGDKRRAFVK